MIYLVEMSADEYAVNKVAISESISTIKILMSTTKDRMQLMALRKELHILERLDMKVPEMIGGIDCV